MSSTQSNMCLKGKKMTSTIKKQLSTPIKVMPSICDKKKTVPSSKKKCNTTVPAKSLSTIKKHPDIKPPKPSLLSNAPDEISNEPAKNEGNTESNTSCNSKFDLPFVKNNWTSMSDTEKQQSTVNFLNTIKDDIITAYEMLTDFRNSDALRDELADLSKISSMIGEFKLDEAPADTENSKKPEIITETCEKEVQTTGVRLEDVENNLKNASEENSRLCSELEAANKITAQLQRDLEVRTDEFNSISAESSILNLKIRESNSAIEVLKKDVLAKIQKLNTLYQEKNKFKYELFDKIKETDKIAEELINEQEKNTKLSSDYLKAKLEAEELSDENIQSSLQITFKTEELNLRTEEVAHLEKIIAVQKQAIDVLTEDNEARAHGMKKLKSKVKWLEETINSKKNCLITTCVRDKLEGKIETLKNEKKQLQMNIDKLTYTNDQFASEISEHKAELENYQNTKHNYLKDQESVIEMMRELLVDEGTSHSKPTVEQIKSLCDELLDTKRSLESYEKLMTENWMLKTKNNELSLRLYS